MLTKNDALVSQIKVDYTKAIIDSKTLAMLNYAVKLTVKPTSITDEEVNILRDRGCTDREILDVCQITSYFNFVNRMAEGLGVELEEEYR
jgi:uncharacterized peroxidase-related enzyme